MIGRLKEKYPGPAKLYEIEVVAEPDKTVSAASRSGESTSCALTHMFISILAYHLMHAIEHRLRAADDERRWNTIRAALLAH